ncbi:MAG: hypothetical protein R2706_11565 [Acidimicrobiales bacterium]
MTSTPATLRLGGVPEHYNLPWHLALASAELADLDLDWTDQLGGTGQMLSGLEDESPRHRKHPDGGNGCGDRQGTRRNNRWRSMSSPLAMGRLYTSGR